MSRLAVLVALAAALVAFVALPSRSDDGPAGDRRRLAQDAGATAAGGDRPGSLAVFETVAPVESLMTGLAGSFSRVREALEDVEERNRLRRVESWSEVVAELANVVVLHGPDQAWRDLAADTRETALELASASRAEAVDELLLVTLVDRIDASCAACHDADY